MVSKALSVIIDNGFYPSAGAMENICPNASGFSSDIMLACDLSDMLITFCYCFII